MEFPPASPVRPHGSATTVPPEPPPTRCCQSMPTRNLFAKFSSLCPFIVQCQARTFFEPRQRRLAFRGALPVFFVQVQDIEKRGQQRLKILPIVLVGSDSRSEFSACLRKQPVAVNLQQLGGLLYRFEFSPKFKGDLLRLDCNLSARSVQVCLRLVQFRTLSAAAIDRNTNTETEHVVGAELRGVRALPHVLQIKIRIEILARKINLQIRFLNRLLSARDRWVLGLRRRH